MRKSYWGIPVFELAVVLIVAGGIGWMLYGRAEEILERSEHVAVDATLMNIRSGVRLEKARRIVTAAQMRDLEGSNPLLLLQAPPVGYPGFELIKSSKSIKSGLWWFSDENRTLHYQPKRFAHLSVEGVESPPILAWALRMAPNGDVELVTKRSYQWF